MTSKERIAKRIAREFNDGELVNLGAGIPLLCTNYIPDNRAVYFLAENGIVGARKLTEADQPEQHCYDAGGTLCGIVPGGAIVDSPTSFGLIRGGHLTATVLGTMQVDEEGSLANWIVPGGKFVGMGGAMDLAIGAARVIVATEHCDRKGNPKILKKCTFPLTALQAVSLIVTELAVIEVTEKGLLLKEIAPGITVEELKEKTGAELIISPTLEEIVV